MKNSTQRRRNGFTLIELMAVITIIVILAGLVVGGMGFVNERQASEKAKVQIALLSKALEEYKLDNGAYPATSNSTTGTQSVTDANGKSSTLFDVLYLDGVKNDTKVYLPELDPDHNKQGWTSGTSTKILDPWGKEYAYRSAVDKSGKANSRTQNPDFDLWSLGKDGLTNTNPKHRTCADDIRNF
ncbi:MAG: type II secretion system protein GspG [Akkermansiaceae bacterium]|nr:type II secretion system protein GspG [Akkermansiaceae bacterium]MCP5546603.1 type II secretion system protein GspG [Akkermansiaceae bacterium]